MADGGWRMADGRSANPGDVAAARQRGAERPG
jgi:hypothetical protein